jgi:hypothetical protein
MAAPGPPRLEGWRAARRDKATRALVQPAAEAGEALRLPALGQVLRTVGEREAAALGATQASLPASAVASSLGATGGLGAAAAAARGFGAVRTFSLSGRLVSP